MLVKARLAVMTDDDIGERPRLLLLGDDRYGFLDRAIFRFEHFDSVGLFDLAVFISIFPGFVGGLDFSLNLLETRLLLRREFGRVALERAQVPGVVVADMGRGNDADFRQPLTGCLLYTSPSPRDS